MTDGRRIEVLLVEDDPADAGLVRHALRSLGDRFAVTHRATLGQALAWMEESRCDVVLLDLSLPDSSGFATIRRVREARPTLPVVVLTGHDDEDFAIQAMAAGTQDYLFKGATDGPVLARAIRYAIARVQLEERLRRSEQRLNSVISLAQDAIVSAGDDQRIVMFNPAAERMFGYPAAAVLGRPLGLLLPERFRAGHAEHIRRYVASGVAARPMSDRPELVGLTRDGCEFPIEVSISKETHPDGLLVTAMIRDVTERKRHEGELRRLATVDPLTGLFNRRHFLEVAALEMARVRRYGHPATALMVDVDHFKRVNDTHGHAAGDEALRSVAATMRAVLRETDVIGRLGGEEFGLLLPETGLDAAAAAAERLRVAIAGQGIGLSDGAILHLTASFGVSPCGAGETSVEQALRRADRALYRAKQKGRNRVDIESEDRDALAEAFSS